MSNEDYNDLKEAIEKLSLSDSALQFEPGEFAGSGLRCANWIFGSASIWTLFASDWNVSIIWI